jgi:cytohesin
MAMKITSIHYAAEMGETDALRRLILEGADIESTHNPIYSEPVGTPLFLAAWEEHVETVEVLLQHGANPNYRNVVGNSALGRAAQVGNLKMTNVLLSSGASVDIKDNDGCTPLMIAAAEGHEQVVEALLAAGADVDAQSLRGRTAIDWAEDGRHRGIAKRLAHASA